MGITFQHADDIRPSFKRQAAFHVGLMFPEEDMLGIALDYANRSSREYVESMGAAHRDVLSRSTVERIGKALGQGAKVAAPRIESYLRRSEKVPEEAVALSLGLDRTSVPYEEEREQGAAPKTKRKKRTKPVRF